MTLTYEFDPDNVKMNQPVKYIGLRSFGSKVVWARTDRHAGLIALPGPPKLVGKYSAISNKARRWYTVPNVNSRHPPRISVPVYYHAAL